MKITSEMNLHNFDFWSGAAKVAEKLTLSEFKAIESSLEDIAPEGMTDTQVNDFFWFETETICEWIGITEDELFERD